ncbi:MAG: DNA mismatch repair endonuclease MutL [Clostridia bacterium]|nr:DNA mismatch repair endonuclease MutL [Clostridia bacterium]
MGRINVLGFDVANLIAAGEVVDRPSSVVKELLENAIDSGAKSITVEIKKGGVAFIRVSDDGCGIEYNDLPVAILRHATSKIKDQADLEAIMTLGFRGEALAAIASVSKLRIMSKQDGEEMGGLLECHGGEISGHMRTGCAKGTTVIVEDLFYNVPARKKFLKKDMTEAAAITAVIEKVAMSKPDISFRYIMDGEIKYITSGDGSLINTVYALLGRDIAKKTVRVDREDNGIRVEGFISTPELVRANRNFENFYINSRFVKSKTASAAIEQAYVSYIPSDKFPFCVLNIEIDPSSVDVNVHPSKLEVKFSNEKLIFEAVYYAVKTALTNQVSRPELFDSPQEKDPVAEKAKAYMSTIFQVRDKNEPKPERIVFDSKGNVGVLRSGASIKYDISTEKKNETAPYKALDISDLKIQQRTNPSPNLGTVTEFSNQKAEKTEAIAPEIQQSPEAFPKTVKVPSFVEAKAETREIVVPDYNLVGEVFNTYVIVELGETMYMIDKHAAHERIIFEDLKAITKSATPSSQMLMIPIEVYLTSDEIGVIEEWREHINKTGFSFEINGGCVSIYEIPTGIEPSCASDMFITFATKLLTGEGDAMHTRDEYYERALYQASCKAAIKAGRIYDRAQIKWICDRVLTLDNIRYCPHGRPVAFEITKHFLEKQFERIK